jgi:hypothetical protein
MSDPAAPDLILSISDDIITLFGVKYSTGFFRTLGFGAPGTVLEIVSRDDGTLTLRDHYRTGAELVEDAVTALRPAPAAAAGVVTSDPPAEAPAPSAGG